MPYTVKQLATLSGISTRTLRHYDDICLLKPAYYGENQYRYYEQEQLLRLQQILFYKELGMPLHEIGQIVTSPEFDKIKALESHKQLLKKGLLKTQNLLKTIDKTISYLKGQAIMQEEEFYYGFDSAQQKAHEANLVAQGIVSQEFLDECNEKVKHWDDAQKNQFINEMERIMQELINALENGISPENALVQKIMHNHYQWLQRTWNPNKKSYLGLKELYQQPDFALFYTKRHPKLLNYLLDAMDVYSKILK